MLKEKLNIKKSIRVQLSSLLLVAILATTLMTLILDQLFMDDFYMSNKVKTLGEAYKLMQEVMASTNKNAGDSENGNVATISEESKIMLDNFCRKSSLIVFSTDSSGKIFYTYGIDSSGPYTSIDRLFARLGSVLGDEKIKSGNVYTEYKVKQDYTIYKLSDRRTGLNYLELTYADATTGECLIVDVNIENIQGNVSIANKFFLISGLVVAVLVAIVSFVFGKRFTKPIQEMSAAAEKMTNLDFNTKIRVESENEIGELGRSINLLSEKLEGTITELKNANNQLQTDIESKIQIDEMRKEFISNVSHELKTPIAIIQGYAEGLKENISEDEESRNFYCDVIMDEALKMNNMVKKILTLNQIESGNSTVEIERFNLGEMLKSVIASTEILRKQKGIKLLYSDAGNIDVWADEYMIEEVFTNFLSNAINHVSGEKIIDVKVETDKHHARISVFNTGNNIPESEIDKIWEKFYKVDKARTREYGGSGIGLSIVKAIMEAHHQRYGVVNHSNGVEFWFELDVNIYSDCADKKNS